MLVLTRKTGQRLILDDQIEITILETRGESVKLGIKAPATVRIFREEIYQEIKNANQQAKNSGQKTDLDEAMNLLGSVQLPTPTAGVISSKKKSPENPVA